MAVISPTTLSDAQLFVLLQYIHTMEQHLKAAHTQVPEALPSSDKLTKLFSDRLTSWLLTLKTTCSHLLVVLASWLQSCQAICQKCGKQSRIGLRSGMAKVKTCVKSPKIRQVGLAMGLLVVGFCAGLAVSYGSGSTMISPSTTSVSSGLSPRNVPFLAPHDQTRLSLRNFMIMQRNELKSLTPLLPKCRQAAQPEEAELSKKTNLFHSGMESLTNTNKPQVSHRSLSPEEEDALVSDVISEWVARAGPDATERHRIFRRGENVDHVSRGPRVRSPVAGVKKLTNEPSIKIKLKSDEQKKQQPQEQHGTHVDMPQRARAGNKKSLSRARRAIGPNTNVQSKQTQGQPNHFFNRNPRGKRMDHHMRSPLFRMLLQDQPFPARSRAHTRMPGFLSLLRDTWQRPRTISK